MDFNRNLRIVRTSGSSYPFPYKSNVLWVHHDENNNPVVEIWDHGKWVPITEVGSGSGDIIIDTEMSDSSSNAIANKTVKEYIDGIASKTDASILSLNEGKVDKEQGKGLSTNDYTDIDKAKLDKMPTKVSDLENDSTYQTKANLDTALESYAKTSDVNSKNAIQDEAIQSKQDKLISGTNIKTINNQSILGEGNISIESGTSITVDSALSTTSENPVQNKVITTKVNSLETSLGSKASQTDLDSLSSTVTIQGQTITSIQTEIGNINTQLTEING